jgi:hypothetical protein
MRKIDLTKISPTNPKALAMYVVGALIAAVLIMIGLRGSNWVLGKLGATVKPKTEGPSGEWG